MCPRPVRDAQKNPRNLALGGHGSTLRRGEIRVPRPPWRNEWSAFAFTKLREIRDTFVKFVTFLWNSRWYCITHEICYQYETQRLEKWILWLVKILTEIRHRGYWDLVGDSIKVSIHLPRLYEYMHIKNRQVPSFECNFYLFYFIINNKTSLIILIWP